MSAFLPSTLYGNGEADDTGVLRALLNGYPAFDARVGIDIVALTIPDLPPGLYRVKVPSLWPFEPALEGWGRRVK